MALRLIVGEGKGTSLDEEIERISGSLGKFKCSLNSLYQLTSENNLCQKTYENIAKFDHEYPAPDINDLIADYYIFDPSDITPEEYPEITASLAITLAELYEPIFQNSNHKVNSEMLSKFFNYAISDLYQCPEDFIFEYNEFKKWKETEEPMKKKVFNFWISSMLFYGTTISYYQKLMTAKKILDTGPNLKERIEVMKVINQELGNLLTI